MQSDGYKKIMWGILLAGLHINIGNYQVIPSFIGYFIILIGIKSLYRSVGESYFSIQKSALFLTVLSVAGWIGSALLYGYAPIITQLYYVCFALIELIFYADLMNTSVKLLKESHLIPQADKLRKSRVSFIKSSMAVILLGLITILVPILTYPAIMLSFILKIWLSILMQNMSVMELNVAPVAPTKMTE